MVRVQFNNRLAIGFGVLLALTSVSSAQDRDTKVRDDRDSFKTADAWVYNDLDTALAQAVRSKKPILAVLRCVP
jgi:serine protease Do